MTNKLIKEFKKKFRANTIYSEDNVREAEVWLTQALEEAEKKGKREMFLEVLGDRKTFLDIQKLNHSPEEIVKALNQYDEKLAELAEKKV